MRREALASVGYLDSLAVERAIEVGFEDDAFQLWAMRAMGRTANPDWLDTLTDEAGHPDPAVRQEVARAAGELADERATETVAELVDDAELEVRLAAIKALGQIGGDEARETLIYALEDERAGHPRGCRARHQRDRRGRGSAGAVSDLCQGSEPDPLQHPGYGEAHHASGDGILDPSEHRDGPEVSGEQKREAQTDKPG